MSFAVPSAMIRLTMIAVLALTTAGCETVGDWFGSGEKPPLPGKRISVLALERKLEPDTDAAAAEFVLPEPVANTVWSHRSGRVDGAMHHLALKARISQVWQADIGEGADDDRLLSVRPIVVGNRVFVMDTNARVTAFDTRSGKQVWRVGLARRTESLGEIGGGLAYEDGLLVATTPFGEIFALEPASGRFYWRASIDGPIRGAPAIAGNRVFFLGNLNRMFALSLDTGKELWRHQGLTENAELIGAPTPAVSRDLVYAPYSSGEIYALRVDNGRPVWADTLVRSRQASAFGEINDLDADPVVDQGRVYISGQGGYVAAFDAATGTRFWEQNMSGNQTPWIAGDRVYMVTSSAELVAMTADRGKILWVTQMPQYRDAKKKRDKITWNGPVLAGDRLFLVGDEGTIWTLSPQNGDPLGRIKASAPSSVGPVVANGALYVLTNDGKLTAYR